MKKSQANFHLFNDDSNPGNLKGVNDDDVVNISHDISQQIE